jgi:ankyrin repeat protein
MAAPAPQDLGLLLPVLSCAASAGYTVEIRPCAFLCRALHTDPLLWDALKAAAPGRQGRTHLMHAAAAGDLPRLRFLLARGALPAQAAPATLRTALHWAAACGRTEAAAALLDAPPPARCAAAAAAAAGLLNALDRGRRSALYLACQGHHWATAALLCARGADARAATQGRDSALLQAVLADHLGTAALLLRCGAGGEGSASGSAGSSAAPGVAGGARKPPPPPQQLRQHPHPPPQPPPPPPQQQHPQHPPLSACSTALLAYCSAGLGDPAMARLLLAHGADAHAPGGGAEGHSAAAFACENGHLPLLLELLLPPPPPSPPLGEAQQLQLLLIAARRGDEAVLGALLGAQGSSAAAAAAAARIRPAPPPPAALAGSANHPLPQATSPLHAAAMHGQAGALRLLLRALEGEEGGSCGSGSGGGSGGGGGGGGAAFAAALNAALPLTPLMLAAQGGHTEAVRVLLGAGALRGLAVEDVQRGVGHATWRLREQGEGEVGLTALMLAARHGHALVIRLLMEGEGGEGGEEGEEGEAGAGAGVVAAHGGGAAAAAGLPADNNDDAWAAQRSIAAQAAALGAALQDGEPPHSPQPLRAARTPLMEAAAAGHAQAVRELCQLGAARTPLMEAAAAGHAQAVRVLCQLGAEVGTLYRGRHSALSYAVEEGHEECVRVLLQHFRQQQQQQQQQPLLLQRLVGEDRVLVKAAAAGRVGVVRALLEAVAGEAAAVVGGRECDGAREAHYRAKRGGHWEVVRVLCECPELAGVLADFA